MNRSRILVAVASVLVGLSPLALAQAPPGADSNWSGSGEFGLANATGNTKSLNADAKFKLGYEIDNWKDALFLDVNRAKSNVKSPL
ncbi:MAG: DUF481 domain-containing protein, partial [Rhodanobacteraceae bacterium]